MHCVIMKNRQSNLELLRIISMMFVLIVHAAGASFGLPEIMTINDLDSFNIMAKEMIESISIIGVNCFVIISGYFAIKFSVKGFVRLLSVCLFYSISTFVISGLIYNIPFTFAGILQAILIFPHNDLWFVPAYIWLYIFSSIINYLIECLPRKIRISLFVIFVAANLVLGWWYSFSFNSTGYTAIQLVMLYIIGRAIRLSEISTKINTKVAFTLYIICTLALFVSTFYLPAIKAFAYNSPFVLLASVFFFMIFSSISFSSKIINSIAQSTFAVYLIHKSPYVWVHLKSAFVGLYFSLPLLLFAISAVLSVILLFILCIIIDKLTFLPLYNFLSRKVISKI